MTFTTAGGSYSSSGKIRFLAWDWTERRINRVSSGWIDRRYGSKWLEQSIRGFKVISKSAEPVLRAFSSGWSVDCWRARWSPVLAVLNLLARLLTPAPTRKLGWACCAVVHWWIMHCDGGMTYTLSYTFTALII